MAYDIGPKIGIEGEAQFRKEINNINTNMRTLKTEMQAVASQFDKNDKSQEAYTAKNEVLNKQIDSQKKKLAELEKGLKAAGDKYGENDRVTQGWQQAVNKATADLNKMERELKENDVALKQTKKGLDDTGKAAEDSGHRFEKLSGILKASAAAVGAVAVAAGAAAIKMGKEVVKQFGELEQNLGGSEAVFGEYAKSIQKTGEEAYKNLGVSQSDYLATANKMGALFQGSGVEQQKSLELTEKAMQRAADMASVMGIDMQVALDSVAGAAKGNFTMMDNLGVAMNATNIEAYALAKGLDFTWKTATQAEKAEIAMQMFFENTEQYAGNFAKESTQTVTGSIGLLQAALGSFTAGLGNTNSDMTNLTENLVDAFKSVVANIVPIISNLTSALPAAFGAILEALGELIPTLLDTAITLFRQVLDTLLKLFPELIPVVVEAIMTILDTLIDNLPLIINGAFTLIMALAEGIIEALPELIPAVIDAVLMIVDTIIDNIDRLIDASMAIIVALAGGLIDALPKLIEKIPQIVTTIVKTIIDNLPLLIDAAIEILMALIMAVIDNLPMLLQASMEIIVALVSGLIAAIPTLLAAIPKLFTAMVDAFKKIKWGELGKNIITGIIDGITGAAKNLANSVVDAAKGALDSTKKFLGIKSPSRVMRDQVGKMIGAGMAEGITDSARQVDAAMGGLTNRLVDDGSTNMKTSVNSPTDDAYGNERSEIVIHNYTILDGKQVQKSTSRRQSQANRGKSRALGVAPA